MNRIEQQKYDSEKIIVWCGILLFLGLFWLKFIPWLLATIWLKLAFGM